MSDDGAFGLTIIAFIGSVFSPYYAWARRGGRTADPRDHCAINIALYGKGVKRWAMTERDARQVMIDMDRFSVGRSSLHWDGTALDIHFDEVAVPWPRRLRGHVRITPDALTPSAFLLNPDGRHLWWPIAPQGRAAVHVDAPSLRWHGHAYCDHNRGDAPITAGFRNWTWARAVAGDRATILYEGARRCGTTFGLGLHIDRTGAFTPLIMPPPAALPAAPIWRIARQTRSDAGHPARILSTLEDTPFYARSLVQSVVDGTSQVAVHESLDVDRFARPVVQMMLPFRMPRRRAPPRD